MARNIGIGGGGGGRLRQKLAGQRIVKAPHLPGGGNPEPHPGNGGGNGGNNNGAGNNNPNKPKFNPYKVLKGLETNKLLTPQQLNRAANALTVLETRPEIHGYQRIAKQLGEQKGLEDQGLLNLGQRTTGQVSSAYQNIAQSEAQSLATEKALGEQLNQRSGEIASQGAAALTAAQQGATDALGANLALRGGAPGGSAQEQLAQAVAAQKSTQASDSAAAQQFAASQGASTAGMLAEMAGSAQMQGGATVGQIGRDIIGRKAEADQKYGQSIREALGKKAEAKASFGAKNVKNLLELRANEQKYGLGKAAVQGEKTKLQLEKEKAGEEGKQNAIKNKLAVAKLNNETKKAEASWLDATTNAWEAQHPNASSGEAGKHRKEYREGAAEVRALIPSLVAAYGAPKNQKMLNQFTNAVNSKASANPTIVKKVLEIWWNKRWSKLGHDVNGPSLGR